jgi:BASS family bile acid:Na+ symporter
VKTLIDVAVPATTFILLVAVGFDLTAGEFARIRQQRVIVAAGLIAPLFLLPLTALGLASIFQTPEDVTAGVLLLSACPIGGVSNTYSYLARASTALSVTLTGLSSLFAAVTIPLAGKGIELLRGRPFELDAPAALLITQLLLVLALPVALGMWVRKRSPALAQRIAPTLQRVALIGILLVFALLILADPTAFGAGLSTTVPVAASFVVASFVAGWFTAALATADRRDRFALAAGFGARNVGVATAVAVTFLGRFEFARFSATYAFVEVPLLLAAVALFRRSEVPQLGTQAEKKISGL